MIQKFNQKSEENNTINITIESRNPHLQINQKVLQKQVLQRLSSFSMKCCFAILAKSRIKYYYDFVEIGKRHTDRLM